MRQKNKKFFKEEKGFITAISLVIVVALAAMAVSFHGLIKNDAFIIGGYVNSSQASSAADAGISYGIKKISDDWNWLGEKDKIFGNGSFDVEIRTDDINGLPLPDSGWKRIVAVGHMRETQNVRDRIIMRRPLGSNNWQWRFYLGNNPELLTRTTYQLIDTDFNNPSTAAQGGGQGDWIYIRVFAKLRTTVPGVLLENQATLYLTDGTPCSQGPWAFVYDNPNSWWETSFRLSEADDDNGANWRDKLVNVRVRMNNNNTYIMNVDQVIKVGMPQRRVKFYPTGQDRIDDTNEMQIWNLLRSFTSQEEIYYLRITTGQVNQDLAVNSLIIKDYHDVEYYNSASAFTQVSPGSYSYDANIIIPYKDQLPLPSGWLRQPAINWNYNMQIELEDDSGNKFRYYSQIYIGGVGILDHLHITPDPVSIEIEGRQTFSVAAHDSAENILDISDLTQGVHFDWTGSPYEMGQFIESLQATECTYEGLTENSGTINLTIYKDALGPENPKNAVIGISNISVSPKALDHIHVTPLSESVPVGETRQFTAVGHDIDENVIAISPVWSVTGDIGSITDNNNPCTFSATAMGTGTVVAAVEPVSGSAGVTVTGLNHIHVSPSSASLGVSYKLDFIATGHDSEERPIDISGFNWSVTDGIGNIIDSAVNPCTFEPTTEGSGQVIITVPAGAMGPGYPPADVLGISDVTVLPQGTPYVPVGGYTEPARGIEKFVIMNNSEIPRGDFTINETVKIKVTSDSVSNANTENIISVKNYLFQTLSQTVFTQTSFSEPYVYEASFNLPGASDYYCLDIRVRENDGDDNAGFFSGAEVRVGNSPTHYHRTFSDNTYSSGKISDTFNSGDWCYIEVLGTGGVVRQNESWVTIKDFANNNIVRARPSGLQRIGNVYQYSVRLNGTWLSGENWYTLETDLWGKRTQGERRFTGTKQIKVIAP
jgi:hypothetical protein